MNPAPAHEIMPELLQYTDVIAPNETECALLTGIELTDEDSMLKSADYFRERGVKHLLITLGDRGVFYSTPDDHGLVPAFKVKAVDTTAAGHFHWCPVFPTGKGLGQRGGFTPLRTTGF